MIAWNKLKNEVDLWSCSLRWQQSCDSIHQMVYGIFIGQFYVFDCHTRVTDKWIIPCSVSCFQQNTHSVFQILMVPCMFMMKENSLKSYLFFYFDNLVAFILNFQVCWCIFIIILLLDESDPFYSCFDQTH